MTREIEQMNATALWYAAPGRAELRDEAVAAPGPDDVVVRATHGALSRGTEALIFAGKVPQSEHQRMRGPHMGGIFPFPVKYGYAMVGQVSHGALKGKNVFALHPHQNVFVVPASAAVEIPANIPPQRAVLAANMETALNAMWDAAPGPADRIAIVGTVGALVGFLCSKLPGADVTLVDIDPSREKLAAALGLKFALPNNAPQDCDIVFHTSGNGAGLATAISLAGDEAKIIEMSWYGDGEISLPLGGAFHSRRLTLMSSQVGRVAPSHRPRWPYPRRLAAAMALLNDPKLDALLTPAIPFTGLPAALPRILAPGSGVLCQVIDSQT